MHKNLFQDMVKTKRQSRRNTVPEVHIKLKESREDGMQIAKETIKIKNVDRSRSRYTLWIFALVCVVFFLFALSYFFAKANIIVFPKVKGVTLNESLSASKDDSTGALPFDLVAISGDETNTLPVTTTKDASIKATGVVLVYNALSSSPQTFPINTKLEGSNGKIYKTASKVTISGMKSGKTTSALVKIYADAPGAGYNSTPLDFKIVSLKGTSKYTKLYARSTGPITGGFVGKVPVITDADKSSTITDLKNALQTKLVKKATDQIPAGFILFKDAVFLKTDDSSVDFTSINTADNTVSVTLHGTLYGLLFDENKLTQKIAKDKIEKYDGSPVFIPGIRNLNFALTNKDTVSFSDVKNINFSLVGAANIVWKVDADKLKLDLLGKSKSAFNQTLLQYPSVDSATLSISPVWKFSIPDSSKKVTVTANYPN